MKSFTTITSHVVPIPRKDIDTDLIFPADFLNTTSREGFAEMLFARVRNSDPDFRFVDERKDAQILVARDNFGCGSSREHAVWSILDAGFRVVIAPSFANIFQNNALKNGLLTVVLSQDSVEQILEDSGNPPQSPFIKGEGRRDFLLTVHLEKQKVILPNKKEYEFEIDAYRKDCILSGMDDFDYLLSHAEEIREFDAQKKEKRFFNILNI